MEPASATDQAAAVEAHRPTEATYLAAFEAALRGSGNGGGRRRPSAPARA